MRLHQYLCTLAKSLICHWIRKRPETSMTACLALGSQIPVSWCSTSAQQLQGTNPECSLRPTTRFNFEEAWSCNAQEPIPWR